MFLNYDENLQARFDMSYMMLKNVCFLPVVVRSARSAGSVFRSDVKEPSVSYLWLLGVRGMPGVYVGVMLKNVCIIPVVVWSARSAGGVFRSDVKEPSVSYLWLLGVRGVPGVYLGVMLKKRLFPTCGC